jgi:hypothetical protein
MATLAFWNSDPERPNHGWLCVKEKYARTTEPIMDTYYWPVAEGYRPDFAYRLECLDTDQELRRLESGQYEVPNRDFSPIRIYLKDGGSTKAIHVESVAIPCPKVRKGINTRWNDWKGHWEKELKTGWEPAY